MLHIRIHPGKLHSQLCVAASDFAYGFTCIGRSRIFKFIPNSSDKKGGRRGDYNKCFLKTETMQAGKLDH